MELETAILKAPRRLPCLRWCPRCASASCFCRCSFLSGVARYLFVPLAEAVVFAMLASYVFRERWCRRWRCTCCGSKTRPQRRNPFVLLQRGFERGFERCARYRGLLTALVASALVFVPVFLLVCLSAFLLFRGWARISFPTPTPANSSCTCAPNRHAHRGDRAALRPGGDVHPPQDSQRTGEHAGQHRPAVQRHQHSSTATPAPIGTGDADILVSLSEAPADGRNTCARCARRCRAIFRARRFISCRPILSARF